MNDLKSKNCSNHKAPSGLSAQTTRISKARAALTTRIVLRERLKLHGTKNKSGLDLNDLKGKNGSHHKAPKGKSGSNYKDLKSKSGSNYKDLTAQTTWTSIDKIHQILNFTSFSVG